MCDVLCLQYNCVNPKTSIDDAMEEAKMVTCGAIEGLLKKQGEAQHVAPAALCSGSLAAATLRMSPATVSCAVLGAKGLTLVCFGRTVCKGHRWCSNLCCCICGSCFGCVCFLYCAGLQPKDVDIIVTTCSIFCPTPSITSMVVNHFGMRTDVQSYHLGGMGCSNGVVAVNLINDLLKVRGSQA